MAKVWNETDFLLEKEHERLGKHETEKYLIANQILELLEGQYLIKDLMDYLDFLHE